MNWRFAQKIRRAGTGDLLLRLRPWRPLDAQGSRPEGRVHHRQFGKDVDLQLIPLALSREQCRQYRLPRTPIKDTERRKAKFEETFGEGATELDALEALHPGEMAGLLEAEIDNWLDASLGDRVRRVSSEQLLRLNKIERRIVEQYADQVEDLKTRFDTTIEELQEWESEAEDLWDEIQAKLEAKRPDLSDVEVPRSKARGETDRFVLFNSKRDYFSQMDAYNAWRDGDEADE